MKIFAIFWEDTRRSGIAIVAALSAEKASELYYDYWNKSKEDFDPDIVKKIVEFDPENGPAIFYQFEALKE